MFIVNKDENIAHYISRIERKWYFGTHIRKKYEINERFHSKVKIYNRENVDYKRSRKQATEKTKSEA